MGEDMPQVSMDPPPFMLALLLMADAEWVQMRVCPSLVDCGGEK